MDMLHHVFLFTSLKGGLIDVNQCHACMKEPNGLPPAVSDPYIEKNTSFRKSHVHAERRG